MPRPLSNEAHAREVVGHLEALADTSGEAHGRTRDRKAPKCAVPPEHREAVALYVDTWILPHARALLEHHAARNRKRRAGR